MCGECIFTNTFLGKVINKTVKSFECTDYDDGSEVTITFTDDTKLILKNKIDESLISIDTISKEQAIKYYERNSYV